MDINKMQKFALMSNLLPNKGAQKVGAMAGQMANWQQMKEEIDTTEAMRRGVQNYADKAFQEPLVLTIPKIDEMLNNIYPDGADPKIRDFYINLIGKYGR